MQTNIHASDPILNIPATNTSGASWGAIFAGAAAAAALSLVLMILGAGLGFATISPWADRGLEASSVGISSIVWILAQQLVASALGGYLAGRLRVKWPDVQTDEVFFRDTAHGLLTWAVATLFTAALMGSVLTNVIGTGVKAGAAAVGSAGAVAAHVAGSAGDDGSADKAGGGMDGRMLDYFVGGMFRGDPSTPPPADQAATADPAAATAEATTVLAYSLRTGQLSAEDKTRLGQLITRHTGVSQEEAEKRVAEIHYRASTELVNAQTAAKEAADKARKAAAHISLWLFVALLGGAFCASYAATIGGRQRDY